MSQITTLNHWTRYINWASSSFIIFTTTRKKQNRNPSTIIPVTPFGVLPAQPQQPQLKGLILVFFIIVIFGLFWFFPPGDNRWKLGQKSNPNESLPLYCVLHIKSSSPIYCNIVGLHRSILMKPIEGGIETE